VTVLEHFAKLIRRNSTKCAAKPESTRHLSVVVPSAPKNSTSTTPTDQWAPFFTDASPDSIDNHFNTVKALAVRFIIVRISRPLLAVVPDRRLISQ
jgi:hypothetical protein